MAKGVWLDHVQLAMDMAKGIVEGAVTLDEGMASLKGLTVGPNALLENILRLTSIGITGHVHRPDPDFKPTAFRRGSIFAPETSQQAMRGLDIVNQMLGHPRWRLVVLNHLWEKVKPENLKWLEVFTQHLTTDAAYAILMNLPKTASRNQARVLVSVKVAEYLPEPQREPIAAIAKTKRKIPALYRLTSWQCCHQSGSASTRDHLMGVDLGL